MSTTIIDADAIVLRGAVVCDGSLAIPASAVTNAGVSATAAIDSSKLKHRHRPTYGQPNSAATDETKPLHVGKGAGVVNSFQAGSIAKAVGDAVCTVDLLKNGVSVLAAPITLNNANTNRVAVSATVSSAAYVAGDFFEIVIDGTIGTGTLPTGVFGCAEFDEAA